MKSILLSLMFCAALFMQSCSKEDSPTNAGTAVTARDNMAGTWTVTSGEETEETTVTTADGKLTMQGLTFDGTYSGSNFKGTNTMEIMGSSATSNLDVTMSDKDHFSGTMKTTASFMGQTNTVTTTLTGVRKAATTN